MHDEGKPPSWGQGFIFHRAVFADIADHVVKEITVKASTGDIELMVPEKTWVSEAGSGR